MGATSQQFSLRWNNYVDYISAALNTLRTEEDLVDVTLSCEGRRIFAHKVLLSACSSYFREVFKENPCKHPVIILKNVKYEDLVALVDFMYYGEVHVEQERLSSFLTTAELLAVKGLIESPPPPTKVAEESSGKKRSHDMTSSSTSSSNLPISTRLPPSRPLGTQNPPLNRSNNGSRNQLNTGSPPVAKIRRQEEPTLPVKKEPEEEVEERLEEEVLDEEIEMDTSPVKDDDHASDLKPGPSSGALELSQTGCLNNSLAAWVCEICGKSFKHKDSRRQHYKSHEGSTECPICHYVLSRKYELKVHMRKRHQVD